MKYLIFLLFTPTLFSMDMKLNCENVQSVHYEKGKKPIQAAIDGTMEVIPPIVSAIITTLLAFGIFLFLVSVEP